MGRWNLFGKKDKRIVGLPPKGRSSAEQQKFESLVSALTDYYSNSKLFTCLALLEKMQIYNPDVSHSIRNWINMSNTGHKIILSGGTDASNEKVLKELNLLASNLYQRSFGIDGLINHYLNQVAVTGAISSEDILEQDLSGVKTVELIPVSQIRFRYEEDWHPYQWLNGHEYKLNSLTYDYLAHLLMEVGKPYAKPLIIAAIDPVNRQRDMHENIAYMMKKYGMLGFVSLAMQPPPRDRHNKETEAEYQKRMSNLLSRMSSSLIDSYKDGTMVHFKDQEINFNNFGAMTKGSEEIHRLNEEQVFSGIGIDPAMQGRSFSTTETYAGVVYNLLGNEAKNLQRMVKRRQENTYNLHLQLTGNKLQAKIKFDKIAEKDPKAAAEREKIEIENVCRKVDKGIITPQMGANELGYDVWQNEELALAVYDQGNNEYGLVKGKKVYYVSQLTPSPSLEKRGEVMDFAKILTERFLEDNFRKVERENDQSTDQLIPRFLRNLEQVSEWEFYKNENKIKKDLNNYYERVSPYLDEVEKVVVKSVLDKIGKTEFGDYTDAEDFAGKMLDIVQEEHSALKDNILLQKEIEQACIGVYNNSRFSGKATIKYSKLDSRITKFTSMVDQFFISSYVDNKGYGTSMLKFLENEYNTKGINLWNRMKPETIANFRNAFKDQLLKMSDMQVKRIIDTSIMQSRNLGNMMEMVELEVERMEVYEAMEELACPICLEFHGKVVERRYIENFIENTVAQTPDEYLDSLKDRSTNYKDMQHNIRGKDFNKLVSTGIGTPPYHPHCHGEMVKHREVIREVDGSSVNVVEKGKKLNFTDPVTGKAANQTVKYSVIDKYGQKVYMTDEGYKHINQKHHDAIPKIAGTIRSAKQFGTAIDNKNVTCYQGDSKYLSIVYQNNGNVVWTSFKPTDNKYFKRNYQ